MTDTLTAQSRMTEVSVDNRLRCPICDFPVPTGHQVECTGTQRRPHAPIALSWMWDSVASYEAMYADDTAYHVDMQEHEGQRDFWQRDTEGLVASHARLDALEGIIGPVRGKRLCDIGAGTGGFVAAAIMRGAQAWGMEPCTAIANRAHAMGRIMAAAAWQDGSSMEDIITAHDVMEHLVEPGAFLDSMQGRLLPGGMLVVEMPEFMAPNDAWKHHIRPRQHVCLYSREAAEQLYKAHGFSVVGFYRPLLGRLGKMTHILAKGGK